MRWPTLVMCFGIAFTTQVFAQSIDFRAASRGAGVGVGARWDNVEGAPDWFAGVAPRFVRALRRHTVSLSAGESTTVHLPKGASLRIESVASSADIMPTVEASDGSGLFVTLEPVFELNGDRVYAPPAFAAHHLRVSSPGDAPAPVAIALYISRDVETPLVTSYDDVRAPGAEVYRIRERGDLFARRHWQVRSDAPLELNLAGPAAYRLDVHGPALTEPGEAAAQTRLSLSFNDGSERVFTFPTAPVTSNFIFVDGVPRLLARRGSAYFTLPAGAHTVRLNAASSLFVRVRVERADRLLPGINRAPPAAQPGQWDESLVPLLGAQELRQFAGEYPVELTEYAATAAAWDNRRRDGGLLARELTLNASVRSPDYPRLRALAARISARHTFLRDLYPTGALVPVGLLPYATARVRDPDDPNPRRILRNDRTGDYAASVARARFYLLPGGQAAEYSVPPREFDSELEIITHAPAAAPATAIDIVFDDGSSEHLRFDSAYALPSADLAIDLSTSMRSIAPALAPSSMAASGYAAAPRDAGRAIVPLPAQVRTVTLRTAAGTPAVAVALRYRSARRSRLSAADHLAALRAIDRDFGRSALFNAGLARIDPLLAGDARAVSDIVARLDDPAHAGVARELINEWVPLYRYLRFRRNLYTANVVPVTDTAAADLRIDAGELHRRAAAAAADGDWPGALEHAVALTRSRDSSMRTAGYVMAGRALAELDENFLAEQWWRSCYLFADSPAERDTAFEALFAIYTANARWARREQLLAHRAVTFPQPQHLRALFDHFHALGDYARALAIGLVLPDGAADTASLIYAALEEQRFDLAERLAGDLVDAADAAYLKGVTAARRGAKTEALAAFAAAGERGTRVAEAWHAQLARVSAPSVHNRAMALEVSRAAAALPGPHAWRAADVYVTGHAGWSVIEVPERNLVLQRMRATRATPLQLEVAGPVRLRFDLRLVHDRAGDEVRDAWVVLNDGTRDWLAPITGDRPAVGLRAADGTLPGRLVQYEINLAPGLHKLRLMAEDAALLVDVHAERSLLLEADFDPMLASWLAPPPPDTVAKNKITCAPLPRSKLIECGAGVAAVALEPVTALTVPPGPPGPAAPSSLPPYPAFVAVSPSGTQPPAYARAVNLVRTWEQSRSEQKPALLADLSALALNNPDDVEIQRLVQRATAETYWQIIDYTAASAGIRFVSRSGARSENPFFRTRAALMPQRCRDRRLIGGGNSLTYAAFNVAPRAVNIELTLCEPLFLPAEPLRVELELASGRELITLDPAAPLTRRKLRLGTGDQVVRLRPLAPAVNQYLAVHIDDPGPDAEDLETQEFLYHVATRDEPVVVDIEGPAWLRIDERRRNGSAQRFLTVPAGWQQVELRPRAGETEALYRVHERVVGERGGLPRPRRETFVATPLPEPALSSNELAPAALVIPADALPLGGQEDGTTSIGLRLVSRTRVDDEQPNDEDDPGLSTGGRLRENFLEWQIHQREYKPLQNLFVHANAILRVREHGDPSIGATLDVTAYPFERWPQVGTRIKLDAMLQSPGDALPRRSGSLEWRVAARGEAFVRQELTSRVAHVPRLTVFGGALSLEKNDIYRAESLDRDVFTRYKAEHRHGVRVSDTLSWTPWLDSVWFGRISVRSNEDFNLFEPDNADVRAGWRQLIGELDVGARYTYRRYFPDDLRRKASYQRDVVVDVNWLKWRRGPAMLEAGLRFTHNFSANDNSAQLSLLWHGGNGRGSRDFAPREIAFKDRRWQEQLYDANPVIPRDHPHSP